MEPPQSTTALRPRHRLPLALADLIALGSGSDSDVGVDRSAGALPISGLTADSRLVQPGDLYLAIGGQRTHGAQFVSQAVAAGAVAVLTDPAGADLITTSASGADRDGGPGVPVLVSPDPRPTMAELAAAVYGRPATAMTMFGVTGTNGKTTTSYLLQAGLRAAGRHAGLIGTLGYAVDDERLPGLRTTVTTPESPEVQGLLAVMRERGADAVAMEVSSHALALGRADAVVFDAVGFTNFGRDHLDFHDSLESYFEAKADLFTTRRARHAVINIDDPRGAELVRRARADGLPVTTTSLDPGSAADYRATALDDEADQTMITVAGPGGSSTFALGLPGRYNAHNALTALAMLVATGLDADEVAAGFARLQVPGRMQAVRLGDDAPLVYVDFAHTPQAVGSALAALRDRVAEGGRLVCVVGCGGDRDPAKREPMGAAAAHGADLVIITDDNPRTEDPAAIRAAALAGASRAVAEDRLDTRLLDGGDRRSALRTALDETGLGDVIAVLGKGHETGQEIDGRIWPFDDVAVVAELWRGPR